MMDPFRWTSQSVAFAALIAVVALVVAVAERSYTNIKRWTEMKKGGHFAALEQPDALAKDVTEFFATLKT